jgi:hypothetical protein
MVRSEEWLTTSRLMVKIKTMTIIVMILFFFFCAVILVYLRYENNNSLCPSELLAGLGLARVGGALVLLLLLQLELLLGLGAPLLHDLVLVAQLAQRPRPPLCA